MNWKLVPSKISSDNELKNRWSWHNEFGCVFPTLPRLNTSFKSLTALYQIASVGVYLCMCVSAWVFHLETCPRAVAIATQGRERESEWREGDEERGVNAVVRVCVFASVLAHYLSSYQQNDVIPLSSQTHTHPGGPNPGPADDICECVCY